MPDGESFQLSNFVDVASTYFTHWNQHYAGSCTIHKLSGMVTYYQLSRWPGACHFRRKPFEGFSCTYFPMFLLSHVRKFLEKWMIVDRFQNFFDLSKLQRHGEVSSAMQVPRSESLASSSSCFQSLLYARCCMPGSDSQKWYELELCPQVIYIPGSMASHWLQANAETLSTPQEALGRLPLLHLHTSSGQIKEFSFPGHFWYFTVTAIMPLFKFLPDDFPGTIWCGEKDINIKARFSHSTCCVFFCRSVSLSEPQFP